MMAMKTKPDNILRLKYRLEPIENDMVKFEILKQCKSIKYNYGYKPLGVFNGWEVRSRVFPAVYTEELINTVAGDVGKRILLRGSNHYRHRDVAIFHGHHLIPSIHKALEMFIKAKYGHCKVIRA